MDGIECMVAQRLVNREEFIHVQRRRPEEAAAAAAAAARGTWSSRLPPLDRPVALLGNRGPTKVLADLPKATVKRKKLGVPLEPLATSRYGVVAPASARG
eukprot:SRR837773.9667.p4 GENE.SRR837773.9667~~SRR837773.9667.p4  ORF type:complete len:100 (-),score=24.26 SRR837773.9667:25-324(-)